MSFLPFEDDPSVYIEEEAPTPAPKKAETSLKEIVEKEKQKADYIHKTAPRLKSPRDAALDELYKRDGALRGFTENTPEDKEKFADWLVDDIVSGPWSSTSVDKKADDIFRYEAVNRFGYQLPTKDFSPRAALVLGRDEAKKRQRDIEGLNQVIRETTPKLGRPDLVRIAVTASGEKGDEVPDWRKDTKGAQLLRERTGGLYAGTMLGNTVGIKFDPGALKHQTLIESLSEEDVDPEDRDDLRKLKRGYKAAAKRTASSIDWGETVPPESLIYFQAQLPNGQWGFDAGLEKAKYKQAARAVLAQKEGYASIPALLQKAPSDLIKKISAEAEKQAEEAITQLELQSLDSVLFLKDTRKFAKDLRAGKDPLATFSVALNLGKMLKAAGVIDEEQYEDIAQFRAPWMRVVYPQASEKYGVGSLHYARTAEQMGSGKLDQFFNFGPWTPIFSWLLDPDENMEFGSEDHLVKMGKDYNLFSEVGQLGEELNELENPLTGNRFFEGDWGETAKQRAGFGAALGLTLMEPDLFTALLFGPKLVAAPVKAAAKAGFGVGALSDIGTVRRVRRAKDEVASTLKAWQQKPPETVDEAMEIVRNLTKAGFADTAKSVQAHVAAKVGATAGGGFDIGPDLKRLAGQADKALADPTDMSSDIASIISKAGIELETAQEASSVASALTWFTTSILKEKAARENLRRAVALTGELPPAARNFNKIRNSVKATRGAMAERLWGLREIKRIQKQLDSGKLTKKQAKKLRTSLKKAEAKVTAASAKVRAGLLRAPVYVALKEHDFARKVLKEQSETLKTAFKGKLGGSTALSSAGKLANDMFQTRRLAERTSPKVIEAIREALTEAGDSFGRFEEFLKKPPEARKTAPTAAGTTDFLSVDKGTIYLDAPAWIKDLKTKFGSSLVDDVLDEMWTSPTTDILRRRLDEGRIPVSRSEVNTLNVAGAVVAGRAFQKVDEPLNQARAIIHAWRTDLPERKWMNVSAKEWGAKLAQTIAKYGSTADAARSRQGEWRENVQQVAKQASVMGSENEAEAIEFLITNGARDVDALTFPTLIFQALDTTDNLNTGTRIAAFNKHNGQTVFQNFKNYINGLTAGLSEKEIVELLSANAAYRAVALSYLPKRIRTTPSEAARIIKLTQAHLLTSKTAQEFAQRITKDTLRAYRGSVAKEGVAPVRKGIHKGEEFEFTPDHVALSMMMRGMLHGQTWKLTNDNLIKALGPAVSPADALKANFILGQARSRSRDNAFEVLLTTGAEGFDPKGMIDAVHRWGMTFNKDTMPKVASLMHEAGDLSKQMVRVGRDSSTGNVAFAPQAFAKQIDDRLSNAIKVLDATPASGFDAYNKGYLETYLKYWRTSVTRGLLFPRPAYLVNQAAGDFAQMLMPEGLLNLRRQKVGKNKGALYLSGALPMSFQNAFTYVPWIGPKMTAVLEDLGETAAKAGVPSLTSPLNALVNPFVQRILTGRHPDELYRVKDDLLRSSDLMAEMQRNGVFDAMFNDDLRALAGQLEKKTFRPGSWDNHFDSAKSALKTWQRFMNSVIHQTQNHQRAALYLEYRLRRGASAEEATKAVQSALYDWSHGVTKWEMETIAKWASFYPYTRLAAQQMGNALLEPFTFSLGDTVKNSIKGNTQLNRTRKLGQVTTEGIPTWVDWEEGETELGYAEAVQKINRDTFTWWAHGRPNLGSGVISPEEQERMRQRTGRSSSTWHRVGPSWGTPETMSMYLTLFQGLAGTLAAATGSEHLTLGADATEEMFGELILDQLNPSARILVDSIYDKWSTEGGFQYRHPSGGRRVRTNLQEMTRVANKYPIVQEWITEDEQGYYLAPSTQDIVLSMPIIGTEIPNLFRAYYGYNPAYEEGMAKGISWMLADFSGLARTYTSDPEKSREFLAKRIARDVEAAVKAKQKQAASRGGPGTDLKEYE